MTLLVSTGRSVTPHSLHLFTTVLTLHLPVVEGVLVLTAFRSLRRPVHQLRRVRERPASQVRRRIRLLPDDVIQDPQPRLHQRHSHYGMDMQRPRYPDASRRCQHPFALRNPALAELHVFQQPVRLIPRALVNQHPATCGARYAAVRQQIRRICPDAIHRVRLQSRKYLQRIAMH